MWHPNGSSQQLLFCVYSTWDILCHDTTTWYFPVNWFDTASNKNKNFRPRIHRILARRSIETLKVSRYWKTWGIRNQNLVSFCPQATKQTINCWCGDDYEEFFSYLICHCLSQKLVLMALEKSGTHNQVKEFFEPQFMF